MSLQNIWPLIFLDQSQFVKSNIVFHLGIKVFLRTFYFPLMFIGTFFGSISLCLSENDKMNIFPFFSRSGTTFKNTVGESSPQNGSTRGLNLVLIVIVLLTIFILAIAVVFGISFFRRHQGHKNQGKFVALFAYLLTFLFSWNKISRLNIEGRSRMAYFSWQNASMHPHYTRSLSISPPLQISVFKNGIIEFATVSHFAGSFSFLQMLFDCTLILYV